MNINITVNKYKDRRGQMDVLAGMLSIGKEIFWVLFVYK